MSFKPTADDIRFVFDRVSSPLPHGALRTAHVEYDPDILENRCEGQEADYVLVRQGTDFTCGAACLSALSALTDKLDYNSEAQIARDRNALPKIGINADMISEWLTQNLGDEHFTASENAHNEYQGGIGILNFRNQHSTLVDRGRIGERGHSTLEDHQARSIVTKENGKDVEKYRRMSDLGHWVVLLGRRGDNIRYFDPLTDHIVETHVNQVDWRNRVGDKVGFHIVLKGTEESDAWDSKIAVVRNLAAYEDYEYALGQKDGLGQEIDTSLLKREMLEEDDSLNPAAEYVAGLSAELS